jgi:FtsP/CotA-like multicopper oxidase with cupredoxin domain
LYGALVVRDPADEAADLDLVAILDDSNEARHDPSVAVGPAHGHSRLKRSWLVNGHSPGFLSAAAGSRIRLRLINVSNHGYIKLNGDSLRLVATDQGPLQTARTGQGELLAPGDRAEIEWAVGETALHLSSLPYSLNGGDALGDPVPLVDVLPTGTGLAPQPLRLNRVVRQQHADPGYADIVWTFAGSDRSGRWFINGRRFPEINIERVQRDATVIIEVRNLSPTEHPFHLHGYVFEVLSRNGVAPSAPTYEDTVNLRIRDRVRLRLIADNPGDWMSHCHILPHAEDGMMTVLRVE